MAKITERLAYRIAGIAWTAIYARLCSPATSGDRYVTSQPETASGSLPASELAAA